MPRPDPILTIQVKGRNVDIVTAAVDDVRNLFAGKNVSLSNVHQSRDDPKLFLCYISVYGRSPG
jgi:hypothetical protein